MQWQIVFSVFSDKAYQLLVETTFEIYISFINWDLLHFPQFIQLC